MGAPFGPLERATSRTPSRLRRLEYVEHDATRDDDGRMIGVVRACPRDVHAGIGQVAVDQTQFGLRRLRKFGRAVDQIRMWRHRSIRRTACRPVTRATHLASSLLIWKQEACDAHPRNKS